MRIPAAQLQYECTGGRYLLWCAHFPVEAVGALPSQCVGALLGQCFAGHQEPHKPSVSCAFTVDPDADPASGTNPLQRARIRTGNAQE